MHQGILSSNYKGFYVTPVSFTDINECDNSPCQNNETCTNSQGGYKCACPTGFEGKQCSKGKNANFIPRKSLFFSIQLMLLKKDFLEVFRACYDKPILVSTFHTVQTVFSNSVLSSKVRASKLIKLLCSSC